MIKAVLTLTLTPGLAFACSQYVCRDSEGTVLASVDLNRNVAKETRVPNSQVPSCRSEDSKPVPVVANRFGTLKRGASTPLGYFEVVAYREGHLINFRIYNPSSDPRNADPSVRYPSDLLTSCRTPLLVDANGSGGAYCYGIE